MGYRFKKVLPYLIPYYLLPIADCLGIAYRLVVFRGTIVLPGAMVRSLSDERWYNA